MSKQMKLLELSGFLLGIGGLVAYLSGKDPIVSFGVVVAGLVVCLVSRLPQWWHDRSGERAYGCQVESLSLMIGLGRFLLWSLIRPTDGLTDRNQSYHWDHTTTKDVFLGGGGTEGLGHRQ